MRGEFRPYITNEAWQRYPGRVDAIDDVADQFERPAGAEQFWTGTGSRSVVSMRAWSARRATSAAEADVEPDVHGDVAHG